MALSETIEKMLRPYGPLLIATWKGGVRSLIVVITTIWLFHSALSAEEKITVEALFWSWGAVIVYNVLAIVYIVKYSKKIHVAPIEEIFYYIWDLATHAALLIVIFALVFQRFGLNSNGADVSAPEDFLYFSIITWTTVGYGDITPSAQARMFAATEALSGYVFMGLYLAIILQVMGRYTIASGPEEKKGDDH
jgi:hypothetical protein